MNRQGRFCDGLARRDFLRIGAAGAFGMNLSLQRLLGATPIGTATPKKDVSLIYIFLKGGLSTIDTFDLKPNAPSEIRGEFSPISTKVPGLQIGDPLQSIAKVMDKFSLIRSFTHHDASHGPADHYMLTGYHPTAGFDGGLKPNNQHPSIGSVIANRLGAKGSIPPYICLPMMHNSGSSAYLGATAVPFVIEADPNSPGFAVPDLQPPISVEASRLEDRRSLLAQVDRFQKRAEIASNASTKEVNIFTQRAVDIMSSPSAKTAFDIHAETDKMRDEYGRNTLGQSCLMARRLVESGVRCVTVEHSNWDTHSKNFRTLRDDLLPKFDRAISALFNDLDQRGMLQNTLVLISGEFGRTPRINKDAGRDHWSRCFTVALGGGGIQGGRVIGKSDRWAEDPVDNPYGPEDMCATTYHLMGIDPRGEMITPEGRPVMITNNGRIIKELL